MGKKVYRASDFKRQEEVEGITSLSQTSSNASTSLPPFTFSFTPTYTTSFRGFEIVESKEGIMFRNHTGYHIFVTPYTVDVEGNAQNNSLYAWLHNLVNMKSTFTGHESEPLEPNASFTKGEALEVSETITIANLTKPMTAFIDLDEATREAKRYIKWLGDKQEALSKAMSKLEEEDLKADAVDNAKREMFSLSLDALVPNTPKRKEGKE